MGLADRAIRDFARFSSDGSVFGVTIAMTAPNGQTAIVKGFTTEHYYAVKFDDRGDTKEVNSQKSSVAFSESVVLTANTNYPLRNSGGKVQLKNHLLSVTFASGVTNQYDAQQWFPDEKLGCIVVILNQYDAT